MVSNTFFKSMKTAYTNDKRTIRAVAPIENAMATTSRTEIMMKLAVRVTLVEDRLAHITSDSGDSSVMTLSGSASVSLHCCDERIVHFYAHEDSCCSTQTWKLPMMCLTLTGLCKAWLVKQDKKSPLGKGKEICATATSSQSAPCLQSSLTLR